jgi:methyl-accepting chemotaxis protein
LASGNLADRANLEGFDSSDKALLGHVNALLETVCSPLDGVIRCVNRLADGDVPSRFDSSVAGGFAELKTGLNKCIDNMHRFRVRLRQVSEEHTLGNIDNAMDGDGLPGVFSEAAQLINEPATHISQQKNERSLALISLAKATLTPVPGRFRAGGR